MDEFHLKDSKETKAGLFIKNLLNQNNKKQNEQNNILRKTVHRTYYLFIENHKTNLTEIMLFLDAMI